MSSSTQYRVRPTVVPTYRVTTRHGVSGVRVLNLTQMLGDRGSQLVRQTLEQTPHGWQRTSTLGSEHNYQLEVRAGLPAGVSSLLVDLRLADGIAEVTNRWTYQSTEVRTTTAAAAVPVAVRQQVDSAVGRSVNRVLMHTVANQVQARLKQQIGAQRGTLQQTLLNRLRGDNQVQLLVQQRAMVGQ